MKWITRKISIGWNAPVTLAFIFTACIICALDSFMNLSLTKGGIFSITSGFDFNNPLYYVRLFTHVLGHSGFEHLMNNMLFVLILGTIIEDKFGSKMFLLIIVFTALITGLIFSGFSAKNTSLCGASGIVFMMIILASSVGNRKPGTIPLTMILAVFFFMGKELFEGLKVDNISQMSHIIGGFCGAILGYFLGTKTQRSSIF